ncbi:MAG TPA: hypothetical protein VGQ44_17320 [Gemmatimonadaceae bacterium]|jgi:hypothetical protein|nr:hypothetical protein [Gemmatimonadaceae bacterium]
MTVRTLLVTIGAVGGAFASIATVTGYARSYLDGRYVAAPVFALYVHDDSLRHVFAQRERARTAQVIDSIEKAHQRPEGGRVLQAGNPR